MKSIDDINLDEVLKKYGRTRRKSKLGPLRNQIMFLYYNRISIRNIVKIVCDLYQINVCYSSVREFILSNKEQNNIVDKNSNVLNTTPEENHKNPHQKVNLKYHDIEKANLHPVFKAAFESRPDNSLIHDPLKIAKAKRGIDTK